MISLSPREEAETLVEFWRDEEIFHTLPEPKSARVHVLRLFGVEMRGRYTSEEVEVTRRTIKLWLEQRERDAAQPPIHRVVCDTCGQIMEVQQ